MSTARKHRRPIANDSAVTSPMMAVQAPSTPPSSNEPRFISLRWRLLLPIAISVMVLSMVTAYLISFSLTVGLDDNDLENLRQDSTAVEAELIEVGELHQREVFRLSNTGGIQQNIIAQNANRLQALSEPNALLAELDLVIYTNALGEEIITLQKVNFSDGTTDYLVLESSAASNLPFITTVLNSDARILSNLITLEDTLYLVSAAPVIDESGTLIGTIVVGNVLQNVLNVINARSTVDVGIYDEIGRPIISDTASNDTISTGIAQQITQNPQTTIIETQVVDGQRYHIAYIPLYINQAILGVTTISQPATTSAAGMAQHIISLSAALVMAGVVVVGYRVVVQQIDRIESVRNTAESLASGDLHSRSNMSPNDEIGQLATALDRYADAMQYRTSALTQRLQSQRRESHRLQSILESLNDGLVILDSSGRMLMTNSKGKQLLGQSESVNLTRLLDTITDTLGPLIAPGIHTVGDATRIAHHGKVLQAQAAAVINDSGHRLGLLVTLRDISDEVRREQRYEQLLGELAQEVQVPIAFAAQDAALAAAAQNTESATLLNFAREIARNARSLQRIIAELKDLQTFSPEDVERVQQPILVSDLLWQLAAQWKTAANTAALALQVHIPDKNYYILGDPRRLQWAIGNLIDNAIKYSPEGRTITIRSEEVQDGQTMHIAILDEGAGIGDDQLPHVFKRFYRGQPTLEDGTPLHQPGTGQGLYLAQRVIEAHNGEITIESKRGEGTKVHVWLPLTADVAFSVAGQLFASQPIVAQPIPQKKTREYSLVPRVLRRRDK